MLGAGRGFSAVASPGEYITFICHYYSNLEPGALTGYSGSVGCYAFINNTTVSNVTRLLFCRYIDL